MKSNEDYLDELLKSMSQDVTEESPLARFGLQSEDAKVTEAPESNTGMGKMDQAMIDALLAGVAGTDNKESDNTEEKEEVSIDKIEIDELENYLGTEVGSQSVIADISNDATELATEEQMEALSDIELKEQMEAVINGTEIVNNVFQYQIVENLIPQIGSFLDNGYTTEEMKMQNEGRKIMHLPELLVNCTCVRVPVVRSHSISLTVVTEDVLDLEEVKLSIQNAGGTKLYDDPANRIYPMPILTSNQDLVYVGRIRRDIINEKGISIWCAGDQVRKGAATNAIQIMLKLVGLM